MAKAGGEGKTPEFLVELIRRAVAEKSKSVVARESGLALLTVQRYLKGIGEPSKATLEKLAAYFGVSVAWLQGEFLAGKHGGVAFMLAEPTAICAKCGGRLQPSPEGFLQVMPDGTEIEGDGILRFWPCDTCCKE